MTTRAAVNAFIFVYGVGQFIVLFFHVLLLMFKVFIFRRYSRKLFLENCNFLIEQRNVLLLDYSRAVFRNKFFDGVK